MTLAEANQHAKLQLYPSSRFCTGIRWSRESASCLVTMSTVHGCDRQADMTMKKTRCSTEVTQRKMNRLINSGKRVDGVDRFSAESSRSTESSKVESIDFQSSWVDSFDSIDFKDCHHYLSLQNMNMIVVICIVTANMSVLCFDWWKWIIVFFACHILLEHFLHLR